MKAIREIAKKKRELEREGFERFDSQTLRRGTAWWLGDRIKASESRGELVLAAAGLAIAIDKLTPRHRLLLRALRKLRDRVVTGRAPDFTIGGDERPYLLRWFVIPRNPIFNVYLHCFKRSDDDRALHDHPWINCSILIEGTYVEHTIPQGGIHCRVARKAGDIALRRARAAHRVEITDGDCWTLFITGPRVRRWGFHCPKGWVHWKDFVNPTNSGEVGPGCGDAS